MPLSDYVIPTGKVPLPGGQHFVVKGLGLHEITYLVQNHLGDLVKAVDLYSRHKKGVMSATVMSQLAMIIAKDLPGLATEIISVGCEERDQQETIRRLTIIPQVNALLTIVKLTTEEFGGLKNLLAFVAPHLSDVVNSAGLAPGTLKKRLVDSILASGVMSTLADQPDTQTQSTTT